MGAIFLRIGLILAVALSGCSEANPFVGVWQSGNHQDIIMFSKDGSGEILAQDLGKRNLAITYTVQEGDRIAIAPYGQTWTLLPDDTLAGGYTDGSAGIATYHRMREQVTFCGEVLCYAAGRGYY